MKSLGKANISGGRDLSEKVIWPNAESIKRRKSRFYFCFCNNGHVSAGTSLCLTALPNSSSQNGLPVLQGWVRSYDTFALCIGSSGYCL